MLWGQYSGPELREWMVRNRGQRLTARQQHLQHLEAAWLGVQYDARQYLWDGRRADHDSVAAPVVQIGVMPARAERRPCFQSGLAGLIVARFSDLLFGVRRRPRIVVEGDEATTAWVEAVWEQAEAWGRLLSARDYGGAVGTCVLLVRVTDGAFRLDVLNPRHCWPRWKSRSDLVLSGIEERYPYVDEQLVDGQPEERMLWYRRIVDEQRDVIWRGVHLEGDACPVSEQEWGPPDVEILHGLGVCPVVWVHNEAAEGEIDGRPDIADPIPAAVEQLDYLLSEGSSSAISNMDATVLITGIRRDKVGVVETGHHTALVLEPPDAEGRYLELSGSSLDAGQKQRAEARSAILEQAQCVLVDPEDLPGMGQGRDALESVYRPMLDRCSRLRQQQEKLIRRLVDVAIVIGRKVQVSLPPRSVEGQPNSAPPRLGTGGPVRMTWGPYFEPTASDRTQEAAASESASRAGLLSGETLTRHLAPLFGVQDVTAELARLAEERERAEKKARQIAGQADEEEGDEDFEPARGEAGKGKGQMAEDVAPDEEEAEEERK